MARVQIRVDVPHSKRLSACVIILNLLHLCLPNPMFYLHIHDVTKFPLLWQLNADVRETERSPLLFQYILPIMQSGCVWAPIHHLNISGRWAAWLGSNQTTAPEPFIPLNDAWLAWKQPVLCSLWDAGVMYQPHNCLARIQTHKYSRASEMPVTEPERHERCRSDLT